MRENLCELVGAWIVRSGREWSDADEVVDSLEPFGADWGAAWAEVRRPEALVLLHAVAGKSSTDFVDYVVEGAVETLSLTPVVLVWPRLALLRARRWRHEAVRVTASDQSDAGRIVEALRAEDVPLELPDAARVELSEYLVGLAQSALAPGVQHSLSAAIAATCSAILDAHQNHPLLLAHYQRFVESQQRSVLAHSMSTAVHCLAAASCSQVANRAELGRAGTYDADVWELVRRQADQTVAYELYHALHHSVAARARARCSGRSTWDMGTLSFASAIGLGALHRRGHGNADVGDPHEARKNAIARAIREAEKVQQLEQSRALRERARFDSLTRPVHPALSRGDNPVEPGSPSAIDPRTLN